MNDNFVQNYMITFYYTLNSTCKYVVYTRTCIYRRGIFNTLVQTLKNFYFFLLQFAKEKDKKKLFYADSLANTSQFPVFA